MSNLPTPPDTYQQFVARFPKLGDAWDAAARAGREGPLDAKVVRLVKLSVAVGALREGAVHANVRKALAEGISAREVEQVIALAAATIGLPATVAVFSWARDLLGTAGK